MYSHVYGNGQFFFIIIIKLTVFKFLPPPLNLCGEWPISACENKSVPFFEDSIPQYHVNSRAETSYNFQLYREGEGEERERERERERARAREQERERERERVP